MPLASAGVAMIVAAVGIEKAFPSFLLVTLNWPTHTLKGPIKRYNFFTFPGSGTLDVFCCPGCRKVKFRG